MTVIHDEKNEKMINELYCILSKDENGEGICNAAINGVEFQMVAGREENIPLIKNIAEIMSKKTTKKLYICKFSHKEIIEEIK